MSYLSGLSAAIWLLGLFAAAPALRTSVRYDFADRLRDALVLGVAIPFALGFVHALYPIACWCALALCVAIAGLRGSRRGGSQAKATRLPLVLIGALIAVAWPQLMRPLLDGDSLSYHLPNAASWVQAHSLWTTATRYWWYPPASELFGAGLYAVGGPFALPWSGLSALALLGLRIVTWARDACAAPPLLADSLGAAVVTAYPLAIQGGTMQNDVWLAAFFLESLWALRNKPGSSAATRALAVTALIKPQGWILALIALATGNARRRLWLTTAGALTLWALRDAILLPGASAAPASTFSAGIFGSTIVAHGVSALGTLLLVAIEASPFALLTLIAALAAPAFRRGDGNLRWAACAAGILFFVLPFGYATSVAQLATGASLRFAAPAMATGAIVLAPIARRTAPFAIPLLLASTVYGVAYLLAIFWNDGGTHVALVAAAIAIVVAAISQRRRLAWIGALVFALAVVEATHLAARHPLDYYSDALSVDGIRPGTYRWIAATQPRAIGGWGLRLGVVNVLAPATRTIDLPDINACGQAHRSGVVLVAVAQSDLPRVENAYRLRAAGVCGRVLYRDAIGVAAAPVVP